MLATAAFLLAFPSAGFAAVQCGSYAGGTCNLMPPIIPLPNIQPGATITNGLLTLRHGSEYGGAIVALYEPNGANLVNNIDAGRQIQMALFESNHLSGGAELWNPNQAGNGPHGNPLATQHEIMSATSSYVYAASIPLQFWNYYYPIYGDCAPREEAGEQFRLWTEFLSSTEPVFTIKSQILNAGTHAGNLELQHLTPFFCFNRNIVDPSCVPVHVLNREVAYVGNRPWTGDAACEVAFPAGLNNCTTPGDCVDPRLLTEHWYALIDDADAVQCPATGSRWGVAVMTESSEGTVSVYDKGVLGDPVGTYQNPNRALFFADYFPIRHPQSREGRSLVYVGDWAMARAFFEKFSPVEHGAFTEQFSRGTVEHWDVNSYPNDVYAGAARLVTPDDAADRSADLSLSGLVWGSATYRVKMRVQARANPTAHWGIAIRKTGNQRFAGEVLPSLTPPIPDVKTLNGHYWVYVKQHPLNPLDGVVEIRRYDGSNVFPRYVPILPSALQTDFVLSNFDQTRNHELTVVAFNDTVANTTTFDVTVDYRTPQNQPMTASRLGISDDLIYATGYVSLAAFLPETAAGQNAEVLYDNVVITPAPGAPSDPAPTGFSLNQPVAGPAAGEIDLSWTNPPVSFTPPADWLWTRIVRSKDAVGPQHKRDGDLVYEGRLSSFRDVDLESGTTYYYRMFVVDRGGNWAVHPPLAQTLIGVVAP